MHIIKNLLSQKFPSLMYSITNLLYALTVQLCAIVLSINVLLDYNYVATLIKEDTLYSSCCFIFVTLSNYVIEYTFNNRSK